MCTLKVLPLLLLYENLHTYYDQSKAKGFDKGKPTRKLKTSKIEKIRYERRTYRQIASNKCLQQQLLCQTVYIPFEYVCFLGFFYADAQYTCKQAKKKTKDLSNCEYHVKAKGILSCFVCAALNKEHETGFPFMRKKDQYVNGCCGIRSETFCEHLLQYLYLYLFYCDKL